MFKKKIKYTDFFGVEREEDFRFHFSEAELSKMELSTTGGITRFVDKIIQTKDNPKLVDMFEKFILDSYGEISEDGTRFVKSEELSRAFSQTPAYSILFMEILSNDESLAEFIMGVLPENIKNKMEEAAKEGGMDVVTFAKSQIESATE